jgi:spore germination protein YaaH
VPVVVNDVFSAGKLEALKSASALSELFSKPEGMARHIADLTALARDYDGIEIDYERIPRNSWGRFAEFIARLGRALHAEGKRLYVDLEPGPLYDGRLARDTWPELAKSADGLNLMDYYESGGLALRPGAGSSLPWAVETARRALQAVGGEKLVVVLSLAGTEWTNPTKGLVPAWRGKRLHYGEVMRRLAASGAAAQWDKASSTPFFQNPRDEAKTQIWFENERSLKAKIDALRKLGVSRIGFWYWGKSHPDAEAMGLSRR